MSEPTQAVQRHIPRGIAVTLGNDMPRIAELLPSDVSVDQFKAALFLQLSTTPKIHEASPESVASAVIKMALHGFLPGRDAALVVFYNKKAGRHTAEMIAEYRGLIRELDRTGRIAKSYAQVVRDNDHFEIDYGTDTLSHKPCLKGPRGNVYGAYAIITMRDGTKHFHYMALEDLQKVRAAALGRDQEAWTTWPEEMYRKTPLKTLCKYLQLTPKLEELLATEDARTEEPVYVETNGKQAAIELFGGYYEEGRLVGEDTSTVDSSSQDDADTVSEEKPTTIDSEASHATEGPGNRIDVAMWDAALCGAKGEAANIRRRYILSMLFDEKARKVPVEQISSPAVLIEIDWDTKRPLFEYLCAYAQSAEYAAWATDQHRYDGLRKAKAQFLREQAIAAGGQA